MRVLTVSQAACFSKSDRYSFGVFDFGFCVKVFRDGCVISGCHPKRDACEISSCLFAYAAGSVHLLKNDIELGRVGNNGNELVVLCRRTEHARSADIDILDSVGELAIGICNGFFKRIKVHTNKIDRLDRMLLKSNGVFGVITQSQQCPVYFRVQRLYSSVHHFRETRDRINADYIDAGFCDLLCSSPRADDLNALFAQFFGEINNACFVRYTN